MKNLRTILLFISLVVSFTSCKDDDIDTLKGKSFVLQSSSNTKDCLSFEQTTSGRYFSLSRHEGVYTINNSSVVQFSYVYDYPKLSISTKSNEYWLNKEYTFISKNSFSDGEYTWTKCDLDSLVSSNNNGASGGGSSQGHSCSISPTSKSIGGTAGSFTISVTANTSWSASLNNSGSQAIKGMRLTNTSGTGNGNITVSYDAATTTYYQEIGTVLVTYTSYGGYKQTLTCSVSRKHLPH